MIDIKGVELHKKIQLLKPLGFNDYNALQLHSKAVLSDSGTISEESSILNLSALNIRETHERPEGMEEAAVMMVDLDIKNVAAGLTILDNQKKSKKILLKIVDDYNSKNISEKVLRIIYSYTDYINKNIWKKF
jgi:UDP-N-acetylglucosamine 2-epimerase (non-hydrolysing)